MIIASSIERASIAKSLVGGALIGGSASLLWHLNGRIAGISGIVAGMVDGRSDEASWQRLFIVGLLAGGVLFALLSPAALVDDAPRTLGVTVLAGSLVGIGTRVGGGCTSGHGVCGIGRLSPRSFAATAMFMTTAMVTVLLTRNLWGGVK